ncbi:MAG: hypothetical protein ABIN18_23140 [Pseudomonadota bacterium]
MPNLHIRLSELDEQRLQFLKDNGFKNVSELIKELIALKVENIQNDVDNQDLISPTGHVAYDALKKELVIYEYRVNASQPGMFFDLIESGKIRVDEVTHTLHIRI